ncbi:TetR/AcrR family transcriptional regulator [Pseudactinotalea suaedae]|uniref:TetR/AcrR family transcriptional regulator n=1 Tax=Pseudactinotalea suaedae TaxID=1524924 RepID=UPI0012E31DF4|nr:TetR/AcrR family transcriptional regulator [Pseudactinotalea suaedae]
MPRSAEQYEQLRDATRENVQTAAIGLFARHGFAATTMRQIAAAAGISAGLIYRHYASKDVLFEELLAQAVHGLDRMAEALREAADPAQTLRATTEAILGGLRSDPAAEFFMVMNQGFTTDDPPGTAARLTREHTALWEATTELIRRGQREAGFPPGDPAELTTCYFATLSGLVTLRAALGPGLPVPSVEVLLRPLVGEGR